MTRCQEVYNPDKWRHKYGIEPITENKKQCNKEALPDNDYCEYHSDSEHREAAGLTESEIFANLIEDEEDVLAPSFQSIELSDVSIRDESSGETKILHPIIEDNLDIWGADFNKKLTFVNGKIGTASFRDIDSDIDLELRKCVVEEDLTYRLQNMHGEIILSKTDVYGHTDISDTNINTLNFGGSRFGGVLFINNAEIDSDVNLSNCEFWTSLVIHNSNIGKNLNMNPINPMYQIYISESDIKFLDTKLIGHDDGLVRIQHSNVHDGDLRQQEVGKSLYDLSYSKIGDVNIEFSDQGLDDYYFNYTDFSDFDFTKIHNQLKDAGWQIHNFDIDVKTVNERIKLSLVGPASTMPFRKYAERFEIRNYIETYIRAKERATRQGDSRSASEFLINEMRAKREKRRHEMSTKDMPITEWSLYKSAQWKNQFLDITCGFGEKPWKAALSAAIVPVLAGIVLPFLGGVKNESTGQEYAFSFNGTLDLSLVFETALQNLTFSILAFSTMGSGQLVPVTIYSKFLMGFLAILGPFFVALFVFTLGKQVTR